MSWRGVAGACAAAGAAIAHQVSMVWQQLLYKQLGACSGGSSSNSNSSVGACEAAAHAALQGSCLLSVAGSIAADALAWRPSGTMQHLGVRCGGCVHVCNCGAAFL